MRGAGDGVCAPDPVGRCGGWMAKSGSASRAAANYPAITGLDDLPPQRNRAARRHFQLPADFVAA